MFFSSGASSSSASSSKALLQTHQEQLVAAQDGLDLLLNDDISGAKKALEGQEEDRLSASMETLSQAEKAAKKGKTAAENEPGQWWTTPGLEYDVLVADVVAAQSLLHVLGDSYVEYMKAVWKLNSAFKYFQTIYKAVFPQDIDANSTVQSIVLDINDRHRAAVLSSSLKAASLNSKSGGAMGRLRKVVPKNASTSDLLGHTKTGKPVLEHVAAASVPGSGMASSVATPPGHEDGHTLHVPMSNPYEAHWLDSPMISFIVSGGAFGHALFELIFALMPAKGRKMFSWLGYGTGDRKKAIKLLELSAMTGTDIHSSFAALALVSYYCAILSMTGWQANRKEILKSSDTVLSRAMQKHDQGTLWLLNKAKLCRLSGDVESALAQLKEAIARQSTFRQAVSSLQYELCWTLLSLGHFEESSDMFAAMPALNSWSHSTYYAMAAGTMQDIPNRTPEQEDKLKKLYEKLPTTFNRKRFMGQPPSSEIYLEKRMKFYKAKTERWIAEGRLKEGADWYSSVKISVASELSLFWNQYLHYPKLSLERVTTRLEGLLGAASPSEIDTPEEAALAHAILGPCYTASGNYAKARLNLEKAEAASATVGEAYTYLGALSRLYLAINECQEADSVPEKAGDVEWWKTKLSFAEEKLDEMFALPPYDMNGRVEGRGQWLKVEITEKKTKLGIS